MEDHAGQSCQGAKVQPVSLSSACSGKCMGDCAAKATSTWVVAACDGLLTIFEKRQGGGLKLVAQQDSPAAPSLDAFRQTLEDAVRRNRFGQIILVGAGGDIGWVQLSLPPELAKHIVAEIQYPLMASWFRQSPPTSLMMALDNVLSPV